MTDYGSYGRGGSSYGAGGSGGYSGDTDELGYGREGFGGQEYRGQGASGYGGRGRSRMSQGSFQGSYQEGQEQRGGLGAGNAYQIAPLVVGGLMAALGLRRGGWLGYGIALAGLGVMQQSFTGKPAIQEWMGLGGDEEGQESRAVTASHSVTINRSPEELYKFWRDFSNLTQVLSNIERIDVIDDRHSHWVAKAPGGMHVSWDAEVTDDQENRRIAWRSQAGADVPNWGHVEFRPAPGGRGTEVHAVIRYEPPAGAIGRMIAKMFGREPQEQMRHDLQQFKRIMETGAGSMGGTGGATTGASGSTTAAMAGASASTGSMGSTGAMGSSGSTGTSATGTGGSTTGGTGSRSSGTAASPGAGGSSASGQTVTGDI